MQVVCMLINAMEMFQIVCMLLMHVNERVIRADYT